MVTSKTEVIDMLDILFGVVAYKINKSNSGDELTTVSVILNRAKIIMEKLKESD